MQWSSGRCFSALQSIWVFLIDGFLCGVEIIADGVHEQPLHFEVNPFVRTAAIVLPSFAIAWFAVLKLYIFWVMRPRQRRLCVVQSRRHSVCCGRKARLRTSNCRAQRKAIFFLILFHRVHLDVNAESRIGHPTLRLSSIDESMQCPAFDLNSPEIQFVFARQCPAFNLGHDDSSFDGLTFFYSERLEDLSKMITRFWEGFLIMCHALQNSLQTTHHPSSTSYNAVDPILDFTGVLDELGSTALSSVALRDGSEAPLSGRQADVTDEHDDSMSLVQVQIPDYNQHPFCFIHQDPRLVADALAMSTVLQGYSGWTPTWWVHRTLWTPQSCFYPLMWPTDSCLRCALDARTDFPTPSISLGPYLIRPTPEDPTLLRALQFILLLEPLGRDQIASLIHYYWNDEVDRFSLVVEAPFGTVAMERLFDSVRLTNRCRDRAWCRVVIDERVIWWPDPVTVSPFQHLRLEEIDPPVEPASSSESTRCDIDTGSGISHAPSGPTDDPDWEAEDEHALLQDLRIKLLMTHCLQAGVAELADISHPFGGFVQHLGLDLQYEDPIPETVETTADAWITAEVTYGLPRFEVGTMYRIHRPNPSSAARAVMLERATDDSTTPTDIIDDLLTFWPGLVRADEDGIHWVLREVDPSIAESCNIPVAKNFVILTEDEDTFPNFEQQERMAVIIEVQIDFQSVTTCLLKPRVLQKEVSGQHVIASELASTTGTNQRKVDLFYNAQFWPPSESRAIDHGDFIQIQIQLHEQVALHRREHAEVCGAEPTRLRSRSPMIHQQSHLIFVLQPAQTVYGRSVSELSCQSLTRIQSVREAIASKWPLLGEPREWAPVMVHQSYATSPYLSTYEALYIVWQFRFLPTITRQKLTVFETLKIGGEVTQHKPPFATVLQQYSTGLDCILEAQLHTICLDTPNFRCQVTKNAVRLSLDQTVEFDHGDFVQVQIRQLDRFSLYQAVTSELWRRRDFFLQLQTPPGINAVDPRRDLEEPASATRQSWMTQFLCGLNVLFFVLTLRSRLLKCLITFCALFEPVSAAKPSIPVYWFQRDWHTMDSYIASDHCQIIVDAPPLHGRQISLVQALGLQHKLEEVDHPCPHSTIQMELPLEPEEILNFRYAWNQADLKQHLPTASCNYHESAVGFLIHQDFADENTWRSLVSVDVYVDGSYKPDQPGSAWSFVVKGYDEDNSSFFLGWCASTICIDPEQATWDGLQEHSSHGAELLAMFYAGWWALTLAPNVLVTFYFDNVSAGHVASGDWSSTIPGPTPVMTRSVHQLLYMCRKHIEAPTPNYKHTKAHQGDPLNELADGLAKFAVAENHRFHPSFHIRDWLDGKRPLIAQLPWLWACHCGGPELPPLDGNHLTWRPMISDDFVVPPFAQQDILTGQQYAAMKVRHLNLMTYNVSTLTPSEGFFSAKEEFLRAQCAEKQIVVIGLQETRARQQVFLDTPNYWRFVSPAKNGVGGTELWFLKQIPPQFGFIWHKSDFTVIAEDAEFLLMTVSVEGELWGFLSAHAPHSAQSKHVGVAWWMRICTVLRLVNRVKKLFLLGDFNAQIFSPFPSELGACGDLHDQAQNLNGEWLLHVAEQYNLWLPATFSGVHTGPSFTWRSAKCPEGKRLDHVALPNLGTWCNAASWVDFDVDAGQVHEDHLAVCASLSFEQERCKRTPKKAISRDAIRHTENRAAINEILNSCQKPDWSIDIHSHYDIVTQDLFEKLAEKFPMEKRSVRRPYISEESWTKKKQKTTLKRLLHTLRDKERIALLRVYWHVWLQREDLATSSLVDSRQTLAITLQQLKCSQISLRSNLRDDRSRHLAELSEQVDSETPQNIYIKLKQLGIGSFTKKKGRNALPMMEDDNGRPALSYAEAQMIWKKHAEALEFGTSVSHFQHWQTCVARQLEAQPDTPVPLFMHLPTLQEVEKAMRRVKFNKATGPDSIVGELLHSFPQELSNLVYPMFFKSWVRCMEPVSAKGGTLVRAWKNKGSLKRPESYRGLLLENHLAKVLHTAVRTPLLPFYACTALPMQIGGRKKALVTHASQFVRAFMSWSKSLSFPAGVVFLDIRTAFYKVVRQLVARQPNVQYQLLEILRRFDLPATAYQELLEHLNNPTVLSDACVHPFFESLLAEYHTSTWFQTPGLTGLSATEAGSRPGDTLADLVYNFVFARVLRSMKNQLIEEGLIFALHWGGSPSLFPERCAGEMQTEVLEAAWADDLALLARADRADELQPKLQRLVAIVFDKCLSYGLTPNLEKGKTEIICSLRGRGSTLARKKLYDTDASKILVHSQHWGEVAVRVVPTYVHLGGRVLFSGSDAEEIFSRLAQVKQTYNKYKRSLFQSKSISLERRAALLLPLVLSILQYGMGTWANYSNCVIKRASQRLIAIYKGLLRPNFSHEQILVMSHEEVLARVQLPSLEVMVHVNRLRHFKSLLMSGPAPLWAILEHERTWLRRTRESFTWLYQQIGSSIPLGDPLQSWDDWQPFIQACPQKFGGWLRRAQQHAILQVAREWSVKHWHCIALEILETVGLRPDWMQKENEAETKEHMCGPCGVRFGTHTAWSTHSFRKHKRVHYLRYYIHGTACESCMREFWSVTRLHRHLRYMTACAEYYLSHHCPKEPQHGRNSTTFRQTEPYVLAPPVDTAVDVTPHRGVLMGDPEAQPHAELTSDLVDLLELHLPTQPDFSKTATMWTVVDQVKQRLLRYPMPYQQLKCTWQGFYQEWTDLFQDPEQMSLRPVWQHIFDVVSWRLCVRWLLPEAIPPLLPNDSREAAYYWLQADPMPVFRPQPVAPLSAPRERYIVHLFSGRRRRDDLQEMIERLEPLPGVILHTLSVDIVFGAAADLMQPHVRAKWFNLFRAGGVIAMFAGPPCESWSEARFNEVPGTKVRPVRSGISPWGLASTSLKEVKQVIVANALMFFALICFLLQITIQRFAMLEHPETPRDPTRPSIWRTALWKLIATLDVQTICIWQGLFGAPSPKPTRLAFTPASPSLKQILKRHESETQLPADTSIGVDATGNFKTARLKEYPPAMNAGLAAVFGAWHSTFSPSFEAPPLSVDLLELVSGFEVPADGWGPDYVPPTSRLINLA